MQLTSRIHAAALALLTSCLVAPGAAQAQSYDLSVTRTADDFYKVLGKDIVIQTLRCDVPATARNSVFKSDADGLKLQFADAALNCDVKAAFGPTMATPGEFAVTVRHDSQNWYEVAGDGTYIRTEGCDQAAAAQRAALSLGAANAGRLVFADGTSCAVEGLYDKLRL